MESGAILGHYRVIKRLGSGGMGEVYLAQDAVLGREVALKVLPSAVAGDSERLRRFVQEARAASALNHPNVAHLYEIGEAGGVHFIAMEYVEGQPLAARIEAGRVERPELLSLMIQAAEALEAAHEKGITHRDVKPANIMVTKRGQVKVLDFGLAKINRPVGEDDETQAMTQPGVVMGTMRYMSPEQALGRDVDPRSDIFSLGVVLYELAAGRQPFAGASAAQTLDRILHAPPDPILGLDADLGRILNTCLEKDRERRYPTAKELVADLRALQRGAEPTVAASAAVTPARRRVGPALAAAAAALAVLAGLGWFWLGRDPGIHSLAVLPFANTGGNPETEYLSDGITDNLINSLSRTPGLKVAARSLAYRHKGKDVDPRQAGQDLKVRAILTGRVTQRGEALTVQAELMDVSDGSQLWGQQYNRKLAEASALHDEIAREITGRLRLRTGEAPPSSRKRYRENAEAYQAYLKGRHYAYQYSPETSRRAVEYLQQAVQLDPGYAPAYAALAEVHILGTGLSNLAESMLRAKAYATKAVEIDDTLAEARTALGMVKYVVEWDWAASDREFRRGIELNPNYVWAHDWYGWSLAMRGRFEEAEQELRKALELDPLSPAVSNDLADLYRVMRQPDRAIEQHRKTFEIAPDFWLAKVLLGVAHRDKGNYQAALESIDAARRIDDSDPLALATLGTVHGKAGRRAEARKVANELRARSKKQHVSPYWLAMVWAWLDKDRAFAYLEKAYEERFWMNFLKAETGLDPLRGDPRYQDLLRRVGLQ
jgi:serine/threonine protein kinase/tetratricopeptide (TPR) repeat protein